MIFSSALFAISLSIDSLGIGITYGLKSTKIMLSAKFILFFMSFIISLLAINIGGALSALLSPDFAKYIGVCLLFFMGLWVIFQAFKKDKTENKSLHTKNKEPRIYKLFIKQFGITIQIIRNPISSDLDNSQSIDWKEAIYLGIATSCDSFASGIGISTLGVNSILFPVLVATFQLVFLSLGNILGKKIKSITRFPSNIWTIISGLLLIVIGFVKVFI